LINYCRSVPHLTIVRNDVYARFSHADYNKGTALAEIARQLGLEAREIFAAGDHLNDLPMLSKRFAHWLAAPANAVGEVKAQVVSQGGHVSKMSCGEGIAEALKLALGRAGV
jgi:hydroxymethylpyrimidine pyrophosphatase-like HAD family hydrolase